jgi:hypothetical protein
MCGAFDVLLCKQDRQCKYNVTLQHICVTNAVTEIQQKFHFIAPEL